MIVRPIRVTLSTTFKMANNGGSSPFTPLSEYEDQEYEGELSEIFDSEPTVFVSEGVMTKTQDVIKISFDESQIVGVAGAKTEISFNEKKRESMTMIRTASMTTALVFDRKEKRNMCIYDAMPFPFEIMIHTDTLTNNVTFTDGGKIYAEYTLEIRGVQAENSSITLKVEPISK